jgi:hypothetical protein
VKVDLGGVGLSQGGHLLVLRGLRSVALGERVEVVGEDPALSVELRAWARARGIAMDGAMLIRGPELDGRWRGAVRSGDAGRPVEEPPATWGLAARGAAVEAGAPAMAFPLSRRSEVWTDDAARLYARAAAAQWDPASIPWDSVFSHPEEVEDAVVQVMTFLIENENAALLVPARFLGQLHPHFREVMQVLAVTVADEARHVEVFTRRALLRRPAPALSTVGGQSSLGTLLTEPDFGLSALLLSVLGEGSFLELLRFLGEHGPDPVTRTITRLAAQDEARHVAFAMAHLQARLEEEPDLRVRMRAAIERRHAVLANTSGLNEEVYDALILLAAGGWEPARIATGAAAVTRLVADMDAGRRNRLRLLGFDEIEAEALSSLHTRNFM